MIREEYPINLRLNLKSGFMSNLKKNMKNNIGNARRIRFALSMVSELTVPLVNILSKKVNPLDKIVVRKKVPIKLLRLIENDADTRKNVKKKTAKSGTWRIDCRLNTLLRQQ